MMIVWHETCQMANVFQTINENNNIDDDYDNKLLLLLLLINGLVNNIGIEAHIGNLY